MSENIVSNIKKLMIDLSLYTGALVLGPLLLFGGIGYLLDYYLKTKPVALIVCIILAIIFSNILVFKKVMALNKIIKEQAESIRKEKNNNET